MQNAEDFIKNIENDQSVWSVVLQFRVTLGPQLLSSYLHELWHLMTMGSQPLKDRKLHDQVHLRPSLLVFVFVFEFVFVFVGIFCTWKEM